MTWVRNHVKSTEWVLEELYQTGRQLMSERARERRYAPITAPVMLRRDHEDAEPNNAKASGNDELKARFERLVNEFVDRLDRP